MATRKNSVVEEVNPTANEPAKGKLKAKAKAAEPAPAPAKKAKAAKAAKAVAGEPRQPKGLDLAAKVKLGQRATRNGTRLGRMVSVLAGLKGATVGTLITATAADLEETLAQVNEMVRYALERDVLVAS